MCPPTRKQVKKKKKALHQKVLLNKENNVSILIREG
jgi:hypothetical protein